jgi:hypothetical protein
MADNKVVVTNKGIVSKIFGAIMVMLGAMDCMLAWRGSFQISEFYIVLIGLGLALFCFGTIVHNQASKGSKS